WPSYKQALRAYARSCDACQHSKTPKRTLQGLLNLLPILDQPWSTVAMEFASLPLP
ncbi:hypothetical protein BDK51DRAFT_10553, partial [Blyttiomyces helicus]